MKSKKRTIENNKQSIQKITDVLRNVISLVQQSDMKNTNTHIEFKEFKKNNK